MEAEELKQVLLLRSNYQNLIRSQKVEVGGKSHHPASLQVEMVLCLNMAAEVAVLQLGEEEEEVLELNIC